VVAFDIPVNRGILGPDAEWVTPEEDRGECARLLAQAVTRILNDRERAQALSVAGRKRAEAELSMEAQGRNLIEVYESLLEGGA
jgi:glycosyltransferase involved in cell wall biosynthesis